jgi:hypothetical protein
MPSPNTAYSAWFSSLSIIMSAILIVSETKVIQTFVSANKKKLQLEQKSMSIRF